MAAYTRALVEPLYARLETQAERLGRLELELEQSRARVAELELIRVDTAGHDDAPPAERPTGRSWWSRLFRG